MSFIRQVLLVTNMNLRSVLERSGSSLVIIVGIAGSVAVMVSLLAMAEGLSSTISNTGEKDRVIILRDGSSSELSSGVAMNRRGLANEDVLTSQLIHRLHLLASKP